MIPLFIQYIIFGTLLLSSSSYFSKLNSSLGSAGSGAGATSPSDSPSLLSSPCSVNLKNIIIKLKCQLSHFAICMYKKIERSYLNSSAVCLMIFSSSFSVNSI